MNAVSVGQVISHYKILDKLGEGGMGVVYKAEDTKLKRCVALKFLPPNLTRDAESKTRFIREARSASALQHQNICTIHDIDETDDGQLFIVMDYYDGETLQDKIHRAPLSIEEAVNYTIQIATGLDAAHDREIIHRDIKPANIFITEEGVVKLLDFGLAKYLNASQLTRTGTTIGTMAYMSPEQIMGQSVDYRADIWALGVILYEMLTGARPFAGENDQVILYAILNMDCPSLQEKGTDIPPSLESIIRKMLSKDPENRWSSGAAIISALQDLIPAEAAIKYQSQSGYRHGIIRSNLFGIPGMAVILIAATAIVLVKTGAFQSNLNPNRIMVADFENRTGDPALEDVGVMAADWVRQGLLETGFLEVVDDQTSRVVTRYLTEEAGISTISRPAALGQETGASMVVTGSYYLQDENILMQVKLNDVQTRSLLEAIDPIQVPQDDIATLVSTAREQVMTVLANRVDPRFGQHEGLLDFPPSYEAYQAYLKGMELYLEDQYGESTPFFEQAVRLDSTFLHALVWAAKGHLTETTDMPLNDPGTIEHAVRFEEINEFLQKQNNNLTAYDQAHLEFLQGAREADIERMYQAGHLMMQSAPGSQEAIRETALMALWTRRLHESVDLWLQLNPEHGLIQRWIDYYRHLCFALHKLGRHHQELRVANKGVRLHPDDWKMRLVRIRALIALGRSQKALSLIDEETKLFTKPAAQSIYYNCGHAFYAHGYPEFGNALFRRWAEGYNQPGTDAWALFYQEKYDEAYDLIREIGVDDYWLLYGMLSAQRGDTTEALRMSEKYISEMPDSLLRHRQVARLWRRGYIMAWMGEKEEAVQLLREYNFDKIWTNGWAPCRLVWTKPLWGYPPFEELLATKD